MKNFLLRSLLALAVTLIAGQCLGQIVERKPKDSVTAAGTKYITWNSTADGIVGFSLIGIKASSGGGTVNAYAVLERRIDYIPDQLAFERASADTLFLTNVSTTQLKVWSVDNQAGNGYRFKIVSTGTQKIYYYASFLRRSRR